MEKTKLKKAFSAIDKGAAIAAGYSLSAARAAGYSLSAAIAAGYSLSDARAAGYSLSAARAAGYRLSDAIAAGYSLSDAIAAGYSLSDAIAAGYSESDLKEWESIPILEKPYSHLLADIKEKKRIHRQSTWGPDKPTDEKHICDTPMCTAGHLVNMAGKIGWDLKDKYGFKDAATLIHLKTHPDFPIQNFGAIEDERAMAYIEAAAEFEETGVNPFDDIFKAKV